MKTSDVFALLQREGRPMTRAELAESTGLARSTVASRVDLLLRLGLITPYGGRSSTGGRPPSLLAVNTAARVVAAIDLGARHARAAIVDLSGTVLAQERQDLDIADGPVPVLTWVTATIERLLLETERPLSDLAGIGIGLPGPVEHSTGRAINPPIMPGWDRFDVPQFVRGSFEVPVLIDNDVNIMALGEQDTQFPEIDDLILIKVSTGIGAGIIAGGELQRGGQGTAGDIGHIRVSRGSDVVCRCGNVGCLEALAAGPAIARELGRPGVTEATDVVELVRAGDLEAIQAVRQAGRDIGDVLAMIVNFINPSVVVIGGALAEAGEHLIAGIREEVYRRSLPLATEHLRIVPSVSGEQSGVLGAAAMAIGHALSPEAIEQASAELLAAAD
ncbi:MULTISPECIES: ROK family protein [unclassified Aeromicrobium]|uniref:ROK family transcriptional regulator n=1 Tax=unclassified Aeromicrobium TaxID=2633570 RepID=UPI00396B2DEE